MRNVFKDLGTRDNGLTKREFHIGAFLQVRTPNYLARASYYVLPLIACDSNFPGIENKFP